MQMSVKDACFQNLSEKSSNALQRLSSHFPTTDSYDKFLWVPSLLIAGARTLDRRLYSRALMFDGRTPKDVQQKRFSEE